MKQLLVALVVVASSVLSRLYSTKANYMAKFDEAIAKGDGETGGNGNRKPETISRLSRR